MAIEAKTILQVETGAAANSVKALKKEISDYTDILVQTTRGTEEYNAALNALRKDQEKLAEVQADVKGVIEATAGSYNEMNEKMKQLMKEWKSVEIGTDRWKELAGQIKETNDKLKEYDAEVGVYNRNVGDYTNSFVAALDPLIEHLGAVNPQLGQAAKYIKNFTPLIKLTTKAATSGIKAIKTEMISLGIPALIMAIGTVIQLITDAVRKSKEAKEAEIERQNEIQRKIAETNEKRQAEIDKMKEALGLIKSAKVEEAERLLAAKNGLGYVSSIENLMDRVLNRYKTGIQTLNESYDTWEQYISGMNDETREAVNAIFFEKSKEVEKEVQAEAAAKEERERMYADEMKKRKDFFEATLGAMYLDAANMEIEIPIEFETENILLDDDKEALKKWGQEQYDQLALVKEGEEMIRKSRMTDREIELEELNAHFDKIKEAYKKQGRSTVELEKLRTKEEREINRKYYANMSTMALGAMGNLFSSISELYQENAEKQKAFAITGAILNTISGAVSAFMGCQELGQPWGLILGAIEAAAVTATGVAQIAQIKKTDTSGGGAGNLSSSGFNAPQIPAGLSATPLINEEADLQRMTTMTEIKDDLIDTKVYVTEEDINEVGNRVKVRESNSSF